MHIILTRLIDSQIPQLFRDLQLEDYRGSDHAVESFKRYLLTFVETKGEAAPFLVLRGNAMSGKTFFGTFFLRTILATLPEKEVLYLTVERLTDLFYSDDRIPKADVYFLDNLNETDNLGYKNAVSSFVSSCHDEGRNLVVATRTESVNTFEPILNKSYGKDTITQLIENALIIPTAISPLELRKLKEARLRQFM